MLANSFTRAWLNFCSSSKSISGIVLIIPDGLAAFVITIPLAGTSKLRSSACFAVDCFDLFM